MKDPRLAVAFQQWLTDFQPLLGGRVSPKRAAPGTPGPYAVYEFSGEHPVRALRGGFASDKSGLSVADLTLTVWDDDYIRGSAVIHAVNGTRDARGLDGFRGYWPFSGLAAYGHPDGRLAINPCLLLPDTAQTQDEVDPDGQETGWMAFSAVYRIHYVEG